MASAQIISMLSTGVQFEGDPMNSGTVQVYAAGTTTSATVWTNRDKSATHSNPATLDSNGAIEMYGDGTLRLIIKDSGGTTRYDIDDISAKDTNITYTIETQSATVGKTVFTLSNLYTVGNNKLTVFKNGKDLSGEFTETDTSTVTMANAAVADDRYVFKVEGA